VYSSQKFNSRGNWDVLNGAASLSRVTKLKRDHGGVSLGNALAVAEEVLYG
jgi:hypothetical protein